MILVLSDVGEATLAGGPQAGPREGPACGAFAGFTSAVAVWQTPNRHQAADGATVEYKGDWTSNHNYTLRGADGFVTGSQFARVSGLPAWTAPTTIARLTFDNPATDIGYFLTGGTQRNNGTSRSRARKLGKFLTGSDYVVYYPWRVILR